MPHAVLCSAGLGCHVLSRAVLCSAVLCCVLLHLSCQRERCCCGPGILLREKEGW